MWELMCIVDWSKELYVRNNLKTQIKMMLVAVTAFVLVFMMFQLTLVGSGSTEIEEFEIMEVYCEPTIKLANGAESNNVCRFKGITNGEKISGYALPACEIDRSYMTLKKSSSIFSQSPNFTLICY